MKKNILLLMVLLCVPVSAMDLKVENVINDILKNKEHYKYILETEYSKNTLLNKPALTSVFDGKSADDKYFDFLSDFLEMFGMHKGQKPRTNERFYDSLYIVTISRFLCLDPKTYYSIINSAKDRLLKDPPFELLYALSDSIKPYFECIGEDKAKVYLLSLVKLNKNEKDAILNYKDQYLVPLAVRARFGDQESEKRLIEKYNAEKDYQDKERMVSELILAGTERCLENLLIHFNEPIFNEYGKYRDICTEESIRYPIIKGFKRHFPNIGLFRDDFTKVDTLRLPPPAIVIPYLEKFKAWAYDTYKVKPADPDPKPILFWTCKIQ